MMIKIHSISIFIKNLFFFLICEHGRVSYIANIMTIYILFQCRWKICAKHQLFCSNHLLSNTGRVFCWNKTTFDKIGVEIPTTLDELLAAGKAFEAYDDSYYPLVTKELDRAFLMVYYLQCKYGKDWVKDTLFRS